MLSTKSRVSRKVQNKNYVFSLRKVRCRKELFFKLIFSLIVHTRAPQGISITRHATVLVIVRTTPLNTHLYAVSYCLGVIAHDINTHNQMRIAFCRGFYAGVFKHPFTPPGVLLFNPPPSRGICNCGMDELHHDLFGCGHAFRFALPVVSQWCSKFCGIYTLST